MPGCTSYLASGQVLKMLNIRSAWPLALFLSAFSSLALGDVVNGATGAINSTTPTTVEGEITIHTIAVGQKQNTFTPNSINALPGDIVSFKFYPGNHSVIRAEYGYPCIPYEDLGSNGGQGFYSGVMPADVADVAQNTLPTWNVTINSTSPVFFYCGAAGSCVGWGMLGAINADAEHSVAVQINLARQANYMLTPGQPLPAEAYTSMESLAESATTVTVTASQPTTSSSMTTSSSIMPTATAASTSVESNGSGQQNSHSTTLSTGAIAGIAVGGVFVLVLAAGLFYFFGRSKTLSEQLDHARAPTALDAPNPDNYHGYNGMNSRHASGLPAYTQVVPKQPDSVKPPSLMETDGAIHTEHGHGTPQMVSPEMRQQETFGGFTYPDINASMQDRYTRFSQNSGLLSSEGSRQASPQPQSQTVHEMPTGASLGDSRGPPREMF